MNSFLKILYIFSTNHVIYAKNVPDFFYLIKNVFFYFIQDQFPFILIVYESYITSIRQTARNEKRCA